MGNKLQKKSNYQKYFQTVMLTYKLTKVKKLMARQLTFIFLVFGISLSTSAQSRDDNTILAKNVSFEKACRIILDNGFRIDKKDNDLLTATTESKSISNGWDLKMIVYVRVLDSVARLQGIFTWGDLLKDERVWFPASKSGKPKNGTVVMIAWKSLDDLAKLMSADIEYKKE